MNGVVRPSSLRMTDINPTPMRQSLKTTTVCLAFTLAGYLAAFGLSHLCGNTYAQVLIQGGGFSGMDRTSHDIFVCTGAVVGCLIGGFVSTARRPSPMPDRSD